MLMAVLQQFAPIATACSPGLDVPLGLECLRELLEVHSWLYSV